MKKWTKAQEAMYMQGRRDCYRSVQRLLDAELLVPVKFGFWEMLQYILMGPSCAIDTSNADLHARLKEVFDRSIDNLTNNLP